MNRKTFMMSLVGIFSAPSVLGALATKSGGAVVASNSGKTGLFIDPTFLEAIGQGPVRSYAQSSTGIYLTDKAGDFIEVSRTWVITKIES